MLQLSSVLSQREKFICHLVLAQTTSSEIDGDKSQEYVSQIMGIVRESKCNEISDAEAIEIIKQITPEMNEFHQVALDVMKKLF